MCEKYGDPLPQLLLKKLWQLQKQEGMEKTQDD